MSCLLGTEGLCLVDCGLREKRLGHGDDRGSNI